MRNVPVGMASVEDSTKLELTEALTKARDAVQKLQKFRDEYMLKVAEKYALLSEDNTGDGDGGGVQTLFNAETVAHVVAEMDQLISHKPGAVRHLFEDTVDTLHAMEHIFAHASSQDKAEFCYLNGKALNSIQPETCDLREGDNEANDLAYQASQWLTRALKFNPQCTEAWCELGESCWRLGNPSEAANHFRQALKIDPENVEALCQLSMVLRQLPPTATNISSSDEKYPSPANQATNTDPLTGTSALSESLRLAHMAVRHQPSNGHAWSVLGNALLTAFFQSWGSVAPPPGASLSGSGGQTTITTTDAAPGTVENDKGQRSGGITSSQLIMNRCIAAYAQAAKDKMVALEPNFHYNRGVAWHFQDSFTNALCSWLRAICLDPQWQAPRVCATRLVEFLTELNQTLEQVCAESAELKADIDQRHVEQVGRTVNSTKQQKQNHQQQPQTRSRRDSQPVRVADLIAPLGPCLTLIRAEPLSDSVSTERGDCDSSVVPPMTSPLPVAALTKLLGPYCPACTGSAVPVPRKKGKRGRTSGKRAMTFCNNPFNNVGNWKFVLFSDLEVGPNRDRVCIGRVLKVLPSDTELAVNLLLLDARGTPLAVRLYNIGKGLGPVRKDIIAIPHPFIEEREVPHSLISAVLAATSQMYDTAHQSSSDNHLDHKLSELRLSLGDTDENSGEKLDSKSLDEKLAQPTSTAATNDTSTTIGITTTTTGSSILRVRILRVALPDVLVVNGQPVGSSWTAAPVLKNIFFTTV